MEDAQEEMKEGMIGEEYQYVQKENMTTAKYKEHLNYAIKVEEETWQEEYTDDRQGWNTALEEEEKMQDNQSQIQMMKTAITTYAVSYTHLRAHETLRHL
eukprot:9189381-Ditylum_brightwellii.AAC.1